MLPGRWCLLRDTDDNEATPEFDVLVEGDRRAVQRVLRSAGARPVRSWGRAPHRQFTWWDDARGTSVRLDLVDRLSFGPVRELVVDRVDVVLASVSWRDGWPRPSPSIEQWLGLLHGLLDRDRLRPRDLARLEPLVLRSDDDVMLDVLPARLTVELEAAAATGDSASLESLRPDVLAALRRRQPLDGFARRHWRRCLMRTTKVQRAILRPGLRIALLGPDGAGKSTTIRALIEAGVVDGSAYLGVAPAEHRRNRSVPGVALVLTMRRLVAAWMSSSVRRRRGESIALDRHPLEAMIGPPTSKKTTRLRRWMLAHLLPLPDVVVVLMAPPEVLHERKPEHGIDEVVAKRDRYLELARARGYHVVDTTEPPAAVVASIRRAVHDRSGTPR